MRKTIVRAVALGAAGAAVLTGGAVSAGAQPVPVTMCGTHEQVSPPVTMHGLRYTVNTGNFGGHYECVTASRIRPAFEVTRSFGGCAPSSVQAYPNVGTPLAPRQIGSLHDPRVSFAYATHRAGGGWNASIEMWISKTPHAGAPGLLSPQAVSSPPPCRWAPGAGGVGTGPHPDGAEVMIWLDKQAIYMFPPSRFPKVRIDGTWWYVQTWRAHTPSGTAWNYVHYLRLHPIAWVKRLPLAPFYRDAGRRHLLDPRWYLLGMQGGFEVYSGGRGLACTWFRALP